MYLNGLMLVSCYLDGGTAEFNAGNDDAYVYYLPTYAAIAHYHGLHGDRPLREVLDEARGVRRPATTCGRSRRGSRLSRAERAAAVERVAALTGLSADYVDRVNLRPEHIRFFTELLRSRRQTVGRIDGRFTGWEADYGKEQWSSDPSIDAITGPYAAALNHYVRGRAGLPQRPAVRGADQPGAPVVLQGVRGRAPVRRRQAGRGHARQPAHAGARGLRLLRRGDARTSPPSTPSPISPSRRSWRPTSSSATSRPAT